MIRSKMNKRKILIIEDDCDIQELLRYNLFKMGYAPVLCESGEHGLEHARSEDPDFIVLNLMLPDLDGMQDCRSLRNPCATREIPIIMLTAKDEESDVVHGLKAGADDYVTKPFSLSVLLARTRSVLRRRSRFEAISNDAPDIAVHNLNIRPNRHQVMVDGQRLDLTVTEFRMLYFLAQRPGLVFTRGQIVNGVRGEDYPITDRSVDVQIVGLRKKLGSAGKYIETIKGVGYRFLEEEVALQGSALATSSPVV